MASASHIDLASNDGLDALLPGGFIKTDGAEQIAVIGDCGSRHLQVSEAIHEGFYFAGSVKQAVVCVQMQMNEFGVFHEFKEDAKAILQNER
jgi:hypothetical protein